VLHPVSAPVVADTVQAAVNAAGVEAAVEVLVVVEFWRFLSSRNWAEVTAAKPRAARAKVLNIWLFYLLRIFIIK
jgi:hypothetical protein